MQQRLAHRKVLALKGPDIGLGAVQTGWVDQAPAVIRPLTPVLAADPAGRGIRGGDDTITAVGELAAR